MNTVNEHRSRRPLHRQHGITSDDLTVPTRFQEAAYSLYIQLLITKKCSSMHLALKLDIVIFTLLFDKTQYNVLIGEFTGFGRCTLDGTRRPVSLHLQPLS